MSVVELTILDYAIARNWIAAAVLTHTTWVEESLVADSLFKLQVRVPEEHHIYIVIARQSKEVFRWTVWQKMSRLSFVFSVTQVEILASNLVISIGLKTCQVIEPLSTRDFALPSHRVLSKVPASFPS